MCFCSKLDLIAATSICMRTNIASSTMFTITLRSIRMLVGFSQWCSSKCVWIFIKDMDSRIFRTRGARFILFPSFPQ